MATRGSSKELSIRHEDFIAHLFGGRRSKSSGGAEHEHGDVICSNSLVECKMTGHPGKSPKSLPKFVQQLEKVAEEAWQHGKTPVLALRYYQPDSVLAGADGWVDLTVRMAVDDVEAR